MKIKLAILDKDRNYLERFSAAMGRRYPEELEFYLFTSRETALSSLGAIRADVLLANPEFEITAQELPKTCAFGQLSDTPGMDPVSGKPMICKFRNMETLYKGILGVYAEKPGPIDEFVLRDGCRTIGFFGVGGMGTSTVAAACAMHFAQEGKKTLYLNLQRLGGADMYFSGEGQRDMTDLILSLQDPEANLPMQLKSWVREDRSGVSFFAQAKNPLDMLELDPEEMLQLLDKLSGYDYIIMDMDLTLEEGMLAVYRRAGRIVMVGDRSVEASVKADRALGALAILDGGSEQPLLERMSIIYNKVGSESQGQITQGELKVLGSQGIFKEERSRKISDNRKIVEYLAKQEMFDGLR